MNTLNISQAEIFNPAFDLKMLLSRVAIEGYAFASGAVTAAACNAMEGEVSKLLLESGDYTTKPIRERKVTTVTQAHERAYLAVGDLHVPIATLVSSALVRQVDKIASRVPATDDQLRSLAGWAPTEAGYQRYRCSSGHISPHRDRRTDQLLGATITINGTGCIRIHQPKNEQDNYSELQVTDEFETKPGSIMFLRAPGFGSGEQVIHEVLPPATKSRLILNLRMRPDVLKAPGEEA